MLGKFINQIIVIGAFAITACTPSEAPDTAEPSVASTVIQPAAPTGSLMSTVQPAPAQSPPGTWHGERTGVEFFPSGENLAYDKPAPTIHPRLTEHSQKMVPGVYKVAEN